MCRVTIIMPVYNGEKYLKEAVGSILNQTYPDFLLLCIDDCSQDRSLEILNQFNDKRIKVLQNNINKGIAYTRNRGIEMAETEYIAFLDDDDIALPYRLEHEIKYLDCHPEIQVVGGHQRQIDGVGNDINKQWSVCLNPDYIKAYLLLNNTVVNGSAMVRRKFVNKHNIRFKDNMCGAEDYLFWVECSLHGKIKNLDEVFLLWRVAGQNETFDMINNHSEERFNALYYIKDYAFKQNGFCIEKDEMKLLCKIFYEEGEPGNLEDLKELYRILKKIADQAVKLELTNKKEVVTMCRKRFGEKIGKAFFLWK